MSTRRRWRMAGRWKRRAARGPARALALAWSAMVAAAWGGSAEAASSWRDRSEGLEAPIFAVATHGARWLAAGGGAAFLSEDEGRSWRRWRVAGAARPAVD